MKNKPKRKMRAVRMAFIKGMFRSGWFGTALIHDEQWYANHGYTIKTIMLPVSP